MAVADLIQRVRTRGREAAKSAKELAISIVEGANVSDEAIATACQEAGLSYEQFADLIATAQARKSAFDEYHSHDFDNEIAETRKAYKQAIAEQDEVKERLELLTAELRRVGSLRDSLLSQIPIIETQKKEATNKFKAALGANPRDWRVF